MDNNNKKRLKIINGGKPNSESYEYENVPRSIIDELFDEIAKMIRGSLPE